jgi:hypothetical protein
VPVVPSQQILRLRKEMAQLLGFKSYAEMSLASKMAPSAQAVEELVSGGQRYFFKFFIICPSPRVEDQAAQHPRDRLVSTVCRSRVLNTRQDSPLSIPIFCAKR